MCWFEKLKINDCYKKILSKEKLEHFFSWKDFQNSPVSFFVTQILYRRLNVEKENIQRRRTFVRRLRSANTHSRVHSRASQMAILWCLQKPLWDVLKVIYMPLCAINFQRLHACIYAFFIPLMCLSVQGYTTLVSLSLLLSLVKIFRKSDLNFWQQAWCVLFSQDLSTKVHSILISYFILMRLNVTAKLKLLLLRSKLVLRW